MTRRKLRLVAALTATALATPAVAQIDHSKMNMPGITMPAPKKPATKRPAAKKSAVKKPAATKRSAPAKTVDPHAGHDVSTMQHQPATVVDPHAGHDMSTMPNEPAAVADPHAGHDMGAMPQQPVTADPHAGHDMGTMSQQPVAVDPHAGHDMSTMTAAAPTGTDLPAGSSPPPPVPTERAADAVYGATAMHMGRHHLDKFHGGQKFAQLIFNIAEAQIRKGRDGFEWDAEGWYGGDISRLLIKSEGEGEFGRSIEKAEVQTLYSHAVGPYFNVQGGLRYDIKPNPSRVYATIGFEGLAPGFFDIEGALFLSNKGEILARAEGYYDQRITQRLILQPRAELNFAAQNTRETLTGAGLSDAEAGLRLRYDIRREFAPYVGVQYRRAFGQTRDYLRDAGEDTGGWSLLTGVRLWL